MRIGVGLGTRTQLHGPEFGEVIDSLERLGFDSVWLSERITGDAPDPIVGMAFAAGRTSRLKFGMSVLVLPGRNPIVLAKEMATLAVMSAGRLLPAFGLGVVDPQEQQAFGVARAERAPWFDEALTVMRKAWYDATVEHDGVRFHYEGLKVRPQPRGLDVWLGGLAPSELKRVGRMGDGWLPSFVTPADAEAGRRVIEQVASEHSRSIEGDHYGVLIPYAMQSVPDVLLATLARRRPDLADPIELVPRGWDELAATIKRFVDVGTTKFVVLPVDEPRTVDQWSAHLAEAAGALLPLET